MISFQDICWLLYEKEFLIAQTSIDDQLYTHTQYFLIPNFDKEIEPEINWFIL